MRQFAMVIAFVVVVMIVAGCGDDGGSDVKIDRPEVTQTYPAPGASDVNLNTPVRVWFDAALDEATIDSAAFHVEGAQTRRLEYDPDERMITLYLDTLLVPETAYTAMVKSSVKSTAGNSMLGDFDFAFTTGPMDCAHLEDYLEPNDDLATATPIELDTVYPVLSSSGGDERFDFFRFDVEATSQVKVVTKCIYVDTTSVSWFRQFWREEDHQYGWTSSGVAPGDEKSFRFTFHPGTYYVEVRKYADDHHCVAYDLEVLSLPPCEDDAYEDNDFLEEATPVTPGTIPNLKGCYLDRDFFSIHLDTGQTLTATATQVTDFYATRRMKIFNPAGHSKIDTTFAAQGVPISRSWTAEEDGTHYVKVRWWTDGIIYDLDIGVSE
jgi:hypothetical protein